MSFFQWIELQIPPRPLASNGFRRRNVFAASLLMSLCGNTGCSAEPIATVETVSVIKDPTELPPPIEPRDPTTVEIDLTARELTTDLGANHPVRVWTFNGTVPGPFLRVREGDTVILTLTNDPSNVEPHSIDLHAVVGPDGGGAVTEVKPGESKTLTFTATRQGAYLYHCVAEHEPWEHIAYGMYGVILVEPPEGLPPVDHEYYIAQSEWYLTLASTEEHEGGHEEAEGEEGEEGEGEGTEAGGGGSLGNVFVLDQAAARRAEPTLFTFNGHRQALASDKFFGQTMRSQRGESVRIFFGDAGPNMTSSFHVIGAIFDRVMTGHFEDAVRNEETLSVPPGSAAVFEFSTPVPGSYELLDHALFRASMGALGIMHVDESGEWPDTIYSPAPEHL